MQQRTELGSAAKGLGRRASSWGRCQASTAWRTTAAALLGLDCTICMGREDTERAGPQRPCCMRMLGAVVRHDRRLRPSRGQRHQRGVSVTG